jgi:hypothetical protein
MIVTSVGCCYHGDESSKFIKCAKFDFSGSAGFSTKIVLSLYFIAYSERSVCLSVPFRIVEKTFVRIFDLRSVSG